MDSEHEKLQKLLLIKIYMKLNDIKKPASYKTCRFFIYRLLGAASNELMHKIIKFQHLKNNK